MKANLLSSLKLVRNDWIQFGECHPAPLPDKDGFLENASDKTLLALDRTVEMLFRDEGGKNIHSYELPDNSEIFNCGGYLDKLRKYREQSLKDHFMVHGVTADTFISKDFPLLATRSPQLDYLVWRIVRTLRAENSSRRVSLFDLGCTVCEHYDFIDMLLQVSTQGEDSADKALDYCGLDNSALNLFAARFTHQMADPRWFKVILEEGTKIEVTGQAFDISLSVGVINHVENPFVGLKKIIENSTIASVLAMWATSSPNGLWLTSHHVAPFYAFGLDDLQKISKSNPDKKFLVADFIPEHSSTQQHHFVGVSDQTVSNLGCYHVVVTNRADIFPEFSPLQLL